MIDYVSPKMILLSLVAAVILAIFYALYRFREKTLTMFFPQADIRGVLIPRSKVNFWVRTFLICSVWLLLTVAIMGPKGADRYALEKKERPESDKKIRHDVVLLIDASLSMELKDTGSSRLQLAKEIGDGIIGQLKGENVAIEAFTSLSTDISPLTNDYIFSRLMLKQIGINEGEAAGTEIFAALVKAIKKYHIYRSFKLTSLILLSDGGDTAFYGLSEEKRKKRLRIMLKSIEELKDAKLKIFTVGIGSLKGAPLTAVVDSAGNRVFSSLDEDLLKKTAAAANGEYFSAESYPPYILASRIVEKIKEREHLFADREGKIAGVKGKLDLTYDLFFQYPLGLAVILLVVARFMPSTKFLKRSVFALIFFLHGQLAADDLTEKMAEINVYWEAGEWERAENILEEIKRDSLKRWQKDRLLYNIGTIKLAANSVNEAYRYYLAIPFQPRDFPYLMLRLKTNMAIALYAEADQTAAARKKSDLYLAALYNINGAVEAGCYLDKLLGEKRCSPNKELNELKAAVKRKLAIVMRSNDYAATDFSAKEALSYILVALKRMLGDLTLLNNYNFDMKLKKKYLKMYISNMEPLFSLWRVSEKGGLLFKEAGEEFARGVEYLKRDKSGLSALAFSGSYIKALKIMYEIYGMSPQADMLRRLDVAYQRALLRTPLQARNLNIILDEQKRIAGIIEGDIKDLERSLGYLREGVDYISRGREEKGRLRAWAARFWLNVFLRKIETSSDKEVENIVEAAIFNQDMALSMSRQAKSGDDGNIVLLAQKWTARDAAEFFPAVLRQEKIEFAKKCEEDLWREAVPLFAKGYNASVDAYSGGNILRPSQIDALEYWREALKTLRKRKDSERDFQREKEMRKILELLQKMNREDRLQSREKAAVKETARPW